MASVNKVILLGTLGRDPEVRFSANQLPIASLSLATSSFRRSAESQDRIEETEWHRVTLYDGDIRAQSEGLAMLNWLYLFRSRGGLSRSEVCGEM